MAAQRTERAYVKRRRAESEAETRRRITEAAMRLHGTLGPARTTISAVADEAGVQRATVYRHFPDETSLFGACSAHWYSLHPPPDFQAWASVADCDVRLRQALADLYSWYGSDEQMFVNIFRDAALVPAMASAVEARLERFAEFVDTIAKGRPERNRRRRRVRAAIAHAASFPTWHSLTRQGGLSDAEAVELGAALVAAASRLEL